MLNRVCVPSWSDDAVGTEVPCNGVPRAAVAVSGPAVFGRDGRRHNRIKGLQEIVVPFLLGKSDPRIGSDRPGLGDLLRKVTTIFYSPSGVGN